MPAKVNNPATKLYDPPAILMVALLARLITLPVFNCTIPAFKARVLLTLITFDKANVGWLLANWLTLIAPAVVIKPPVPTVKVFKVIAPTPERVPAVKSRVVVPVKVPAIAKVADALLTVKSLSSVTATPVGIIIASALVMLNPGAVPPQVTELDQLPLVVAVNVDAFVIRPVLIIKSRVNKVVLVRVKVVFISLFLFGFCCLKN